MIGQSKLLAKIDTLNKLPHSILLAGEMGSEQEDICRHISSKFNLPIYNINKELEDGEDLKSIIDSISASNVLSLYTLNISKLSEIEQNKLLKIYEEPNSYSYIILITYSIGQVLDTLVNRSYLLTCDLYTKQQLSQLTNNELALSICSTPGQVELANNTDLQALYELCYKISSRIKDAPYYNSLSISSKINFKDEYSKFDIELFIKMLKYVCLQNVDVFTYKYILDYNSIRNILNFDVQGFEHFISNLWEAAHGYRNS